MRIAALARKAAATSTVAIGAGALVLGTALPGNAAEQSDGGSATAAALEAEIAGKVVTEKLQAVWDGKRQVVDGVPTPEVPQLVTGGVLSQDAVGNEYFSAACAGLLGSGAKVSVDADGSCVADSNGRVEVSLGTLPQLGVPDLMSKLPDIPDVPDLSHILDGLPLPELSASLPDAELGIVGQAVSARCTAEPSGARGATTAADLRLVANVAGQEVVLGNIDEQGGLTLSQTDLLNKVVEALPAEARTAVADVVAKLEQLPTDQLAEKLPQLSELVSIRTDVQRPTTSGIEVTALEATVATPATPGVMDGLPTDALTVALGDKLDGISNQLGNLTGELTGEQLRDANLGSASVRVGHVTCGVPTTMGPGSDETVDLETRGAEPGDAGSQRSPNERELDPSTVTSELKQLIRSLGSVSDALT